MNRPILLIMAAGMGSRYGGLKQMDPVGPGGEVILHYSLYDAHRAGFDRVIFLIKREIEADFRRIVLEKAAAIMPEVRCAFQEKEMLPAGFTVPAGRQKPWGTGHAVLCCRELIDAPFAVINADDYYGPAAFRQAFDFLQGAEDGAVKNWMMVGYLLRNTTTDNGHVARGLCGVDEAGFLRDIRETTHIITSVDGPLYTEDGEHYTRLDPDTTVSMNMWGFTPSILPVLAEAFPAFLSGAAAANPLKAEFFLPTVVDEALKRGEARVRVLTTADKWYGVTYQADRQTVVEALRAMHRDGLYPETLTGAQA